MARIVRPGELSSRQSTATIEGASTAGRGQIAAGRELLSVGRETGNSNELSLTAQISSLVDAEGRRIFEESKRAHQSATMLNKMTSATESFITAQQDRYKQQVDEQGNPTFQTLHKDIETIGKGILNDTANGIIDPEVSAQFRQKFGSYVANQKISALKQARRQQVSYGRSSLDNGLGKLVQRAATDDIDQLGVYEQQGFESLENALSGGLISHQEYAKRREEFSTVVREASIQNAITTNRQRAKEMLSLPPEDLGLSAQIKERLTRTLHAAEKSDEAEAMKAQEVQEIDNLTSESSVVENLESKIEAGALREDELLKAESHISPAKFSSLKKKYVKDAENRNKERKEFKDLGLKIVNGEDITDVRPAKIDAFYSHMVSQRHDLTGQPPSLAEEAMLAASIPAPVRKFAAKVEQSVKFGNLENASDMLAAYTYIKDRKKSSLDSGFDNEATLIMEHTELLVERGGVPAPEALATAREIAMKTNEEVRQRNRTLFGREKIFKDDKIEETAASELPGAESILGRNRISADAVTTFKAFAQEGYIKSNGNKDAAIAYAKRLMGRTHGESTVTADKKYMFHPPEKAFPGMDSATLRSILIEETTPLLPEGVDPNTISLTSDDATVGQIQIIGTKDGERVTRNVPTWIATYRENVDGEEIELPIIDPKTGQPKRWTPIGTKVLEQRQAKQVQDAKKEREEFLRKEGQ